MSKGHGEPVDLPRRLAFLRLSEPDAERLGELAGVFESIAAGFVDAFYEHLFAFPETARFLQDPALVERLKQAQREHFRQMFAAEWTDAYVERCRLVGHTHANRGVEPQFFLGAYTLFLDFYLRHAWPVGRPVSREDVEGVISLLKAIFLDVGLTLDAYFLRLTEDLQRALELLWKANSELKQFAQFTSHDLKTPLGTVANLCEEVLDEFGSEIPAEARQLVESARQTAFRMSGTIDELLSASLFAESEAFAEEVASGEVIHEAVERVRPGLDKKRMELVLPRLFPVVRGNKAQLREVFYNLLANAVKYVDRQPGRIEIDVELQAKNCLFSICDNGPGIPEEERERIFAPFRRLPQHAAVPGSGLGLYFTKILVEQQDGRIWADSRLGEGSCFRVLLRRGVGDGSE